MKIISEIDPNVKQILMLIISSIIGFFLRDLYDWLKGKLIKGETLKLKVTYKQRHHSTLAGNPHPKYLFQGVLWIQNNDVVPLFNVKVFFNGQIVMTKDKLPVDQRLEYIAHEEYDYNIGGKELEILGKLPEKFRVPKIEVHYQNAKNKQFKLKKYYCA